jgi:hypothetical protein
MYNVAKWIIDEDLSLLGLLDEYPRQDWMILTVICVLPSPVVTFIRHLFKFTLTNCSAFSQPPVRTIIAVDNSAMSSDDDLTWILGDITDASTNVRKNG